MDWELLGLRVVHVYVGEDAYHFLVGTYGWAHGDWVDWCVTTLLDQVFGLATPPEGILSGTQPTNH